MLEDLAHQREGIDLVGQVAEDAGQGLLAAAGRRDDADADLDKAVETCLADNQPKVAACQKNAFAEATAEIGRDRADSLLATCSKKFGLPIAAAPTEASKTGKG